MLLGIIFILLGIFILYLIIDFFVSGGDINNYGNKWLKKSLWIWLPFYGLWRLTKEMFFQKKK